MKTVDVSGLKNNPSEALRMAHEDMVLVMNRNEPDAVMVGLKSAKIIDMPGVRKALATALLLVVALYFRAALARQPLDFMILATV